MLGTPHDGSDLTARKVATHTTSTAPVCGQHCGTERWPVKTLSDHGASTVNFNPLPTTVSELVNSSAPEESSNTDRLNTFETQAFVVKAKLVGYKSETGAGGDQDFHIVIQDLNTDETMIVEIPDSKCDGVCNSLKRAEIEKARADFIAALPSNPPSPSFVVLDDPKPVVTVTGVGLYDFSHGQTGLAKNCLELHPVLLFQFPAPGKFTAKHDPSREPPKTDASEHTCIPK